MGNNIEHEKITKLEQRIRALEEKNAVIERTFKDGVIEVADCGIKETFNVVWARLVHRIKNAPKSENYGERPRS